MQFLSRVVQLSVLGLVCLGGCVGTIDSVLVVRGSIHGEGVEAERECDLILYDHGHNSVVATDSVVPFSDFVVGFDIPDTGESFQVRVRCPDVETEFRSETFDIDATVDVNLGVIMLDVLKR